MFAAVVLGRNAQKINEVINWKAESITQERAQNERLERMDSKGTISFDIFHNNYEKREDAMTARVRDIEKEIKDIEKRIDP